jgi:hypothetical protein
MGISRLVACLLVLGCLAARAQDEEDDPTPPSSIEAPATAADNRLCVTVHGEADAVASGVVFEFLIRGEGESGNEAEHECAKKIRRLLKGVPEAAPVTTLAKVEVEAGKTVEMAGFIVKHVPNQNPAFVKDAGATCGGRFFIKVDFKDAPEPLARKRLAQVLDKLGENAITGAEDDVDIIDARMVVDVDRLRQKAYAQAIEKAKKRGEALARLSQRRLGKMTVLRELRWTCNDDQKQFGSSYYNVVFPMRGDHWFATLQVHFEVDLAVEFELD